MRLRTALVGLEYPVTAVASPATGGTVTLGGNPTRPGVYEAGTTVVATAHPAPGHHFTGWSDGATDPVHPIPVTGPITLTAGFAAG